jgi:hypothetical protein
MSQSNYKVTITEHDYHYTTYTAWVGASSKNQAIVKAASLAGAEKARREFERNPRHGVMVEGITLEPDVKLELISLEEFWDKRDTVGVSE